MPAANKITILVATATSCAMWPILALAAEQTAKTGSALVHQSLVLRAHHQEKQALQLMLAAPASDRQDDEYDGELACCYLSNGMIDKCIEYCTKVIPKRSSDKTLYRCRAHAFASKKEYQKALPDFTKVIELAPMSVDAYNDRAALYRITGKLELSNKDLAKAANIKRYNGLALDDQSLQMTLMVRGGHYKEAEKILPQYLAGEPKTLSFLSDITKAFAAGGRNEAAVKCATRYLELTAKHKEAYAVSAIRAADETTIRDLLISIYIKQNEKEKALSLANESITKLEPLTKLPPDDRGVAGRAKINLSKLLTARAEVYIALGKRESAREDLERSLSLFPDSLKSRELLKKLKDGAI